MFLSLQYDVGFRAWGFDGFRVLGVGFRIA